MTNWIPLLVRTEDYSEFAGMVAERELERVDGDAPLVISNALAPLTSKAEESDALSEILAAYPSWPEDLLRRLANGSTKTAQRWTRALDVVAASDVQAWFTTSEIAKKSGMTINEWRDAPRKLPQHLKANFPDAPRTTEGHLAWPLRAMSITSLEVSWAMTPETKATWREIRGI